MTMTGDGHPAIDQPDVRAYALVSGLGRIAIGVGLALAPKQALGALGFDDAPAGTVAVSRIAGGRDIAIGVATIAAMRDTDRLWRASIASAFVDAGDAAAFAAAASSDPKMRTAAVRGMAAAVPATIAGLWVAARLRRG